MHRVARCRDWSLSLASLLVFALAGCQHTNYDIEMTPDGKTVTRKLTAWVESTDDGKTKVEPLGSTELAKIAKAYGVEPPPAEPKKQTFQGRFAGLLPDDVGGKGWYLHWENSLGSVTTYSERFRGDDDLTEELNRRLAGANQVADTLVAWAAAEFKEAEGYDALHQYLDVDFRRDINNLSLYWWSYTSLGREEEVTAGEGVFRIGQYLAERGYFDPQEAPQVMRAMQEASQGRPHGLLRFFQRLVATRMGVPADKPIPLSLRFLADQDLVKASLDRFLEKTERYQALVEQWRREVRDDPELEPPEPLAVLAEQVHTAFPLALLFASGDKLRVRLGAPLQPLATNGQWDASTSSITWSRTIWPSDGDHPLPATVLFATWSQPHRMAQEAHFGHVVLEGNNLAGYCAWYAGLSIDEARQWDAFLLTLRAGPALREQLTSFRFANEPPVGVEPEFEGLAKRAIELITQGLPAE